MHPVRTTFAAILAIASSAFAQESAPSPALTLPQAVAHALEYNLDLRASRYEPQISGEDVIIQEAAFDVQLEATAGVGSAKDAYTGQTGDTGTGSVGVTKKISTGATLGLSSTLENSDISTPTDETGVYVSITQPLLRGAWADVTLAELRKAKSALTVSQMQLRSDALDLVLNVAQKYWDLSYAKENYELKKTAVQAAEQLVEEVKAKVGAGLSSDIDLLQAQASLSSKKQELTQAALEQSQAGDELAALMGNLMDQTGTSYTPEVSQLPSNFDSAKAFDDLWPTILSEDLASSMQEESIRQADLDRIVAVSDRKPQLDITLKTGLAGADLSEGDAYDSLADRDGKSWNTSLAFSMPLGRRENIAKARQAGSKLEQAKIKLISVKQSLYKSARQAWRDVELGADRCVSTTAAVDYQKQALEAARAKYSRQLISFRELLDAQTDYDDAQIARIDAQRDLALARAAIARLDGTLPQTLNLTNTTSIPEVTNLSK